MTQLRGIRGATTVENDIREEILDSTEDLLKQLISENELSLDDIATAIFTVTPDIVAAFPAEAARVRLNWTDGAFISAQESPVPGAPTKCIRVLLLVNTHKPKSDIHHVYLKRASELRKRGLDEK
ncbi:MAG: chorismate mutase [Dehalococcoidia bacterium]